MNNRNKQMDIFLQYWAKIYKQNPNYPISADVLYTSLSYYGLTDYEISHNNIEHHFNNWQEYFKNNSNLRVFHDNRQSKFLQFQSYKDPGKYHVKLYLSYPADKIEYSVAKIFDYIASHKMPTLSKVANKLRSDSVVLRMANYEDALAIINFINSDRELSSSAKLTNPFMMRQGHVGISYDGNLSYNMTIIMLMEGYFKFCRKNNILDGVNNKHFRSYVEQFYQNSFRNPENLRKFTQLPIVSQDLCRFQSIGDAIVNYEQVIKLILMQLDGQMKLEQYHEFYERASDNSKNVQMANYYNQFIKQANSLENQPKSMNNQGTQLLHEYMDFVEQEYGIDGIITYLTAYANGVTNAITRQNNFRKEFSSQLPPERLLAIMGDISQYVQKYFNDKKNAKVSENLYDVFIKACIATYQKYGYLQLHGAIAKAMAGDYSYFTNGEESYRQKLKQINSAQIVEYCKQLLTDHASNIGQNNDLCTICSDTIQAMCETKNISNTKIM